MQGLSVVPLPKAGASSGMVGAQLLEIRYSYQDRMLHLSPTSFVSHGTLCL